MAQMWAQWKKFQYLRLYIPLHLELRSRERRTHHGVMSGGAVSQLAMSKKQLHYPNQVLYLLLCNMLMPSIIPRARCTAMLPSLRPPSPSRKHSCGHSQASFTRFWGGLGP